MTVAVSFIYIFHSRFWKMQTGLRQLRGGERADASVELHLHHCVWHWQLPAPPHILFVASLSEAGGQQALFEQCIPPRLPMQTRVNSMH